MGCSSSKSTPTVEDQGLSDENMKNNALKNGRTLVDGVEAKLDEAREAARNAKENLQSILFNSPETERAGNLDEKCAESIAENLGSNMTDSDTPNTMTLNMRKSDDDSDGSLNTDKPPTPMPEKINLLLRKIQPKYSHKDMYNLVLNIPKNFQQQPISIDYEQNFRRKNIEPLDKKSSMTRMARKSRLKTHPRNLSLSDETLCNENDESKSYTSEGPELSASERPDSYISEQQSESGENCDTIKSNIFNAVCTTAANIAMQDTDTEDYSQLNSCSESLRTNRMTSLCSQNSMKTNWQLSGRSLSESSCDSQCYNIRKRRSNIYNSKSNTTRTNCENYDDTYVRLGRQLWKDLENNQDMRMSIPSILEMVKKVNAGGQLSTNCNKTTDKSGNMGLKKNNKSEARTIKHKLNLT